MMYLQITTLIYTHRSRSVASNFKTNKNISCVILDGMFWMHLSHKKCPCKREKCREWRGKTMKGS